MEIERKFLVQTLPSLDGIEHDEIIQAYVSITPESRVRKKGDKYYRTEKGEGAMVRTETEYEITKEEFFDGFLRSENRIIEKTRYYIPLDTFTVELDIYSGRHKGLTVAEVEFDSEQNALNFTPPEWFGKEITNDISFRNKILACT